MNPTVLRCNQVGLVFALLTAAGHAHAAPPSDAAEAPQSGPSEPAAPAKPEAPEEAHAFRDPEDGWFDVSRFLDEVYGFVPVPSLITEPALGNIGGMLGLAFFGKRKEDERVPPNIFGAGGGYTANHSWFLGGGYRGFHDHGRLRVGAWAFYGAPNLDYYVQAPRVGEVSARVELQSYGGGGRVMRKLGRAPVWLGASVGDKQTHLSFDGAQFGEAVDLPDLEARQNQLQVNVAGELDTRDNVFSPTSGSYLHLEGGYNLLRGDQPGGFGTLYAAGHHFFDLTHVVLGFRGFSDNAIGDVPFYLRPYVQLRGVPIARYQAKAAFALESEEMIRLTSRIGLVVFGGWGKAVSPNVRFREADNAWSVGTGLRYLVARLYGLRMGLDVARGPEQFAWYVQFGHAWGGD